MGRAQPAATLMYDEAVGRQKRVYEIHCHKCGKRDGFDIGRFRKPPPFEPFQKHFLHLGWELGRNEERDMCPECVEAEKQSRRARVVRKPNPLDAVFSKTEAISKVPAARPNAPPPMPIDAPQPDIAPSPVDLQALARKFNRKPVKTEGEGTVIPMKAAPAPQADAPSPQDRRLIAGKLSEAYDVVLARYRGQGSDAAVAKELNIPVRWVSEIRELMFGPDVNEHTATCAGELQRLRSKLAKLEDHVETILGEIESAKSAIATIEAKLGG